MQAGTDAILTEDDYERSLAEVADLMEGDPSPRSPRGARLMVLGALVEAYEKEHYPLPDPDPIEAIRFRLEQQGAGEEELIDIIGSRARVWEVLNGKRELTLPMIRRLHYQLGIPAESLIGPATER